MIEFKNVSFSYNEADNSNEYDKSGEKKNKAVEDLDFTINKGEFVAIVGRNGSGKSTCAKLANGLLLPENGTLFVDAFDTKNPEHIWEIRSRVGMAFQNPDNQIIGTTVEEDVAFGPENLGIPYEEMVERVNNAIEIVGMGEYKTREPHYLSGGQKQRVSIAGILAMQPEYIVLDEATAMLDPVGRREVMKVITKLNKELNITVVLITHHMDEVAQAQRAILIDKGKIVFDGTPGELFSRREEVYEAGLETPQVSQLVWLLNKEGNFGLPEDIIDVDTACKQLSELLEGGNYVH